MPVLNRAERSRTGVVFVALLIAICATGAAAREFRAADTQTEDYPTVQALRYMGALIAERSGGRHEVKVFHSRQLGEEKETIEQTRVGAIDLNFDPTNSQIVYATLWNVRRPPWFIYAPANGPGGGIFKSTDGGTTWNEIDQGIPVEGRGRIGISVSPVNHNRIYAAVDAKEGGIFNSEDAGATWTRLSSDKRLWDRGWYFEKITADPKNAAREELVASIEKEIGAQIAIAEIRFAYSDVQGSEDSKVLHTVRAAPRPGVPGTTNRRRSFITSPLIIASLTG